MYMVLAPLYGILFNLIVLFILLFTKYHNMFPKKRIKIKKWINNQKDGTIVLLVITISLSLFFMPWMFI